MTGIAPWLTVRDGDAAVAFYVAAFGASEVERLEGDDGAVVVALLEVHGAQFWLQTDPSFVAPPASGQAVRMILSVDDPDRVMASALASGATEIGAVAEGNGWRVGRIAAPDGHHWEIGRRLTGGPGDGEAG